jgi:drug/metabolite transporter (DMT)-like permease
MDNPLRGILLIIGATMLFSTSDVMSKVLSARMPSIEIACVRYVVFVVLAAALLRRSRQTAIVRAPWLNVLRGLGLVGSAVCFMQSLRSLPLPEAATIGFVSPLLITIFAVPFLGEVIGPKRWMALFVGMAGVLVVMRPGGAAFQPAALWGLGSAASWAVATILTRKLQPAPAAAMLLWSSVTGLVVLVVLLPFVFVPVSLIDLSQNILLGIIASSGQLLMVMAFRHAPASLLAPFSYLQLLWATFGGWLVFSTLPDIWTLVGGVIIAISGLLAARSGHRLPARKALL